MLLLDTHVVLWWLDDPAALEAPARRLIADPRNRVFVSAAVAWEITIKRQLGKLDAPDDALARGDILAQGLVRGVVVALQEVVQA